MTVTYKEYAPAIPHLAPNKSHQFFFALKLVKETETSLFGRSFFFYCPVVLENSAICVRTCGGNGQLCTQSTRLPIPTLFRTHLTKFSAHYRVEMAARQSVVNFFGKLCSAMGGASRLISQNKMPNLAARQSVVNLFGKLRPAMDGASRSFSSHYRVEKTNFIQISAHSFCGKDIEKPSLCKGGGTALAVGGLFVSIKRLSNKSRQNSAPSPAGNICFTCKSFPHMI